MKTIYTIGHSSHSLDYFFELLASYGINTVIDIRSVPFSQYVPHFNKDYIKKQLKTRGFYCIYMGDELGIKQEEKKLYNTEGFLDFQKFQQSSSFKKAIDRITAGIEKGYEICIMCTEKEPLDCHRGILIGPELTARNIEVKHILPGGTFRNQKHLEKDLLEIYFRNQLQESFFINLNDRNHEETLISQAYIKRGEELARKV